MSTVSTPNTAATQASSPVTYDMKLEIVIIPVSDVDRAKHFYLQLGWRLDIDFKGTDYRVIQFTPPGSDCSIMFGKDMTMASPGSIQGLHLVVSDVVAVRNDLLSRGVAVSEPFHDTGGVFHHADGRQVVAGLNPTRQSYASYVSFSDPDGNAWIIQEVTQRLSADLVAGDPRFTTEVVNAIHNTTPN